MAFSKQIEIIAKNEISKIPILHSCTIIKCYNDLNYVDVMIDNTTSVLKYVGLIGDCQRGNKGLLCFVEGSYDNPVVIVGTDLTEINSKLDELNDRMDNIDMGDGNLSNYVKKEDVHLKFDLEDNGTIILGLDIGDGF